MTRPGTTAKRPWRAARASRGLLAALVGLLLVLAGVLVGAAPAAAENAVGATTTVMINTVGAATDIAAGQRLGKTVPQPSFVVATGVAAETAEVGSGAARSPSFIVKPNGETVIVPEGASGPLPVNNGAGFQFTGGSGGHGLDAAASDVRIMDPVISGKHPYPNGYASYLNESGQTINPFTGQTVAKSDPWWHWSFSG